MHHSTALRRFSELRGSYGSYVAHTLSQHDNMTDSIAAKNEATSVGNRQPISGGAPSGEEPAVGRGQHSAVQKRNATMDDWSSWGHQG